MPRSPGRPGGPVHHTPFSCFPSRQQPLVNASPPHPVLGRPPPSLSLNPSINQFNVQPIPTSPIDPIKLARPDHPAIWHEPNPPNPQWSLPLFQSPGPPCRLSGPSPVCDSTRLPCSALVCAARLFRVHRPFRADYRPTPHGSSTRIREKFNTPRHGHDWPRITCGACADHLARNPTLHTHCTLDGDDGECEMGVQMRIHCPSAGRPSRQRLSCPSTTHSRCWCDHDGSTATPKCRPVLTPV